MWGHIKCHGGISPGQGSNQPCTRTLVSGTGPLSQPPATPGFLLGWSSPRQLPPPPHSPGLGDPVFTRVLVPSNCPITALTKYFICLKSLWTMLPEPSIRKTMSISCLGHSVEKEEGIRDACVGPSCLPGPRNLSCLTELRGHSWPRNQFPPSFYTFLGGSPNPLPKL